jgi:hypothetical protein
MFLAIVIMAGGAYSIFRWMRSPKRVWVEYAERYENRLDASRQKDYVRVAEEEELFAEEQLGRRIRDNPRCMVLTRDRNKADYLVSITVIRYVGGGEIFGEATLSMSKRNGDVLTSERFFQTRTSVADIAQMPVSRTWQIICENPRPFR